MSAIAIVGMGCRFAGAPDLQAYWKMTVEGRDGFGPVPADRWPEETFFSESRRATDKSYAPNGGFIDDIRTFPALHFGIPPRRVEVMDPQQRFAIEVSLQAIEDAGYRPSQMPRRTGVYLGVTASEYRDLIGARVTAQLMATGQVGDAPEDVDAVAAAVSRVVPSRPFTAAGVLANMIAAAVAQELDLHGPAYTLDAACASALMALNDAVHALRSHQIDAAVTGGVYLCITPSNHIAFSRIGAISASGACLPFDARADGFVQGDGAGAVILKRLEDAERDGDRIYAVISGVAVNNDGRGDGPMAPVRSGQMEVIRAAWADAGVDASSLGYVETHGTGTAVGDRTEFGALMDALGADVDTAALGSAKANVGHTMSAAGIAGLIRATLAIHHRIVPPMANFGSPREDLGLEASPFEIPSTSAPFDGARVACVSSFGFGGTNGHAVLGPAPEPSLSDRAAQAELVRLSACDEPSLRALARATAAAIQADSTATVAGVARAWAVRPELAWRLAVTATTPDELATALRAYADGSPSKNTAFGEVDGPPPKLALLFPGQGAQRTGMLGSIKDRFPVVDATLRDVERDLSDLLPIPLTHLLYPDERQSPVAPEVATSELTATAACQPALFACGLALWRLLEQVGVEPVAAAGHSLGEFNAAVVGGVLSAKDAARFTARRGAAMAATPGNPGSMAALRAGREQISDLLVDGAVVANFNHPSQVVVSGTSDAISAVVANAAEAGVQASVLDVSHAFHSPLFAQLETAPLLDGIEMSDPQLAVASGIADRPYGSAQDARAVFERHARSPVDFQGALRQCADAGADLFLQVGAGGPLASFARKEVGSEARGVFTLASRDDCDGGASLLQTLGWLWVNGVSLDLNSVTGEAATSSVPPIPLPREPYWAVKANKQLTLSIQQARNRAPVGDAAAQGATDAPSGAEASGDEVYTTVVDVLARVSAYPRAAVQPGLRLVDDLGFDSLMMADLATGLADSFPGLGGLPQELLINQPTVRDIADHVSSARGGGITAADDDEPLYSWRPTWRPTPLQRESVPDLTGKPVLVIGNGERADAVAAAMTSAGADVTTLAPQWATNADVTRILVWCDEQNHPTVGAVLAGERSVPDPSALFIAALDRQASLGSAPDVLLVRDGADPWAAALSGVVRAVDAEWADSVCKSIGVMGLSNPRIAERVLHELASDDLTTDVRWNRDGRAVMGLEPSLALELPPIGEGKTSLITGGTRGIGVQLAERLAVGGARLLLVGRSDPSARAQALIDAGSAVHLRCDVTDREALVQAVTPHRPIHAMVHCAGILADGPLGQVDPAKGAQARTVKVDGWLNALVACGPDLTVALGVGSWAGRFGNQHQAHYAAANAQLADLATHPLRGVRAAVTEFGPWTASEMVQTIPAGIRATMRSQGVDFVGDEAGIDALEADLRGGSGIAVRGRRVPHTTRKKRVTTQLSVESHPYLADHAIDGTPVLPLAAAVDLMADVAGLQTPFEVNDVRLFRGIAVDEPVNIEVSISGERAEIRVGSRRTLAYSATVRPAEPQEEVARLEGGEAIALTTEAFYDDVTFHGPLLAGVISLDAVGPDFARGVVKTCQPSEWMTATERAGWAVDPLALDSAFQLAAMIAWERYKRAGTPVALRRLVRLAPWPEGPLQVDVHFGEADADRFEATFWLRDTRGALIAVAEGAVAELREVEGDATHELVIKQEWIDPSTWPEVKDLKMRLDGVTMIGIRNPYFAVHEGTARNTTTVEGRELVNYSSYNYIGLSGDPRIVADVKRAVETYGTSVSASRVASGERPFHVELEERLAAAQGVEDALVFTAGHATNVTTIGHLFGPGDLVLHDELIHDSVLQGVKLSGAGRRGFKHDNPDHLDQLLRDLRPHNEKCLIVVEGVYSMDGDICNLPAYVELKKKYGCMLMVDEAHSFGIVGKTGRGIAEHWGIDGKEIDLWMGTLSKSLASCGGWIAGSEDLITYLRYTAPGFVYSAGITPANGQAALSSLKIMLEEPWRVEKLQQNARFFYERLTAEGLDTGPAEGASAVVPVVTGNSFHALMLSQRLNDQGVNVQPIVYPAVADDAARLRFFLSSTHTTEQLAQTAGVVAKTLKGIREEFAI